MYLLADFDVVERRLRNVEMAFGDERLHVAIEEGEQERANVCAVHVGVAHDDDAPVAQLRHVEVFAHPHAERGNDVLDLFARQHTVQPRPLDVEDFAAQGQDGLEVAVTALFRAPTGTVSLHQIQFAAIRPFLGAVGEFAGEGGIESVFARDKFAGGAGRFASAGGEETFVDDGFGLARRLFQILHEHVGGDGLDDGAHFGVVQFGLRLRLKLRVGNLDANDGCQALAHIVAAEVAVLLFEQAHLARVVVERAREGAAEAGDMHAAVDGVDAVGEGKFGGVPAIVVLHGQFDFDAIHLAADADGSRLQTPPVLVEVAHEGDQAALKVEGGLAVAAFVAQGDGQAAIKVGHFAETLGQNVETVVARLHHCEVWQERGGGAGAFGWPQIEQGRDCHPLFVSLPPETAFAPHIDLAPFGQRVDDAHAHAVQAATDLVAAATELAACVQDGHNHFERGEAGPLVVFRYRDAAPVVLDNHRAVGMNGDGDCIRLTRHHLVDAVVNDFIDQLVQPTLVRCADIHAGTDAHGLQPFENLDILLAVAIAIPVPAPTVAVAVQSVHFPISLHGSRQCFLLRHHRFIYFCHLPVYLLFSETRL